MEKVKRPIVFIYVGPSCAGKTTVARVAAAPDDVIACRDDLRRMVNCYPIGDQQQEKLVTSIQRNIISGAISEGRNCHVADTNLNKQHRKNLIKFVHEHGGDVHVRLIGWDLEFSDLMKRRSGRPADEQVPDNVLRKQHDQFRSIVESGEYDQPSLPAPKYDDYVPDKSKRWAVAVDIDGTVANHEGVRSPYDYSKVFEDAPHEDILEIVRQNALSGTKIIFVSGRKAEALHDTKRWLDKHLPNVNYDLYTRADGDDRPDQVIKNEIYDEHIIPNYYIWYVLDDRDRVVRHLRLRGIRVLQVAPGNF